jgi:hypothetical protein
MTASTVLLIDAPGVPAREIAERMLSVLGVPDRVIAKAAYHSADDEVSAFGIPSGTDYHGYVQDQGLPAWVRVAALTDEYRPIAVADYEGSPGLQEYIGTDMGRTHLIRIVHGSDASSTGIVHTAADNLPGSWHAERWDC